MYCDKCGTPLNAGARFCGKCGKEVIGGPAPMAASGYAQPAGAPRDYGRVQRHVRTLAILWAINGVLRLVGVLWMTMFGTMVLPFMHNWTGGVWPLGGRWGPDIPLLAGLYGVGIFLGLFGVLHLVLAWGLFEREPWARTLGVVIGILALLRFPLGTALGIYTLWVLLPAESGAEYDRIVQGGPARSATVS